MTDKTTNSDTTETIIQIIKERKPQTVEQLVTLAKEKLQISEREILETILQLQNEGKISLTKQQSQTSLKLTAYLKTEQALWYWITLTLSAATTAVVFAIPENFYPWVYVRYVLGTIFVLWLPGYTFIKALFPAEPPIKTSEKSLDTIELVALSLGMSLALVPIVGLLLNYTPWGIRLTPIVLSLLALTVVFATAAVIREHQAKIKARK